MKLILNKSLKKSSFLFACLLAVISLKAQTIKNNLVIMGVEDSIHSKILNENRKVWVYVPASFYIAGNEKQRYPVVYLLDGDENFPSVTGLIQQLSEINGNKICPDMIVVGILSTDRFSDLTTTKPDTGQQSNVPMFKTSGGGEKFTHFIEKELIPHIDSVYPTQHYKMLIGHSLGGLIVINALIHHTEVFNSYIALDPSLWWDYGKLFNQAKQALNQKSFTGRTLFLGIANTMPHGMDTTMVRTDTTQTTEHIRYILKMKDVLMSNTDNGLKFNYTYYKNAAHGDLPIIAEYDALHFIFNYYPPIDPEQYDASKTGDISEKIKAHYEYTSAQLGYTVIPDEDLLDELGQSYIYEKKGNNAYSVFNLNLQYYPKSAGAHASMANYYAFVKNKPQAIEYYKKSLSLKETKETREKLEKLMAAK